MAAPNEVKAEVRALQVDSEKESAAEWAAIWADYGKVAERIEAYA